MPQFQEEKSERKVAALRKHEEEEVTKMLADRYKLPYVDLAVFPVEIDALKIIPEETSRAGEIAIVREAGKQLEIAVHKPDKPETLTILNRLKEDNHNYDLFFASLSSLEHAWGFYKRVPPPHEMNIGAIQISFEKIEQMQRELTTIIQIKERIQETFTSRTSESLEAILAGALAVDASDVHIEPQSGTIRLRFRLDGVLYDVIPIPEKLFHLLLSRIKLISELKLNIHDRAQDGRFTIKTKPTDIEVRTSTLPGPNGENVVLRILNPKAIQLEFKDLGMQPWVAKAMEVEMNRPNGMILTTGPTGSGKTTTLYTFLRTIYTPAIKVITLEDPIEYHLQGIEQTQVDTEKGYDFANGLRSVVRQDPDVILVGEIRDLETAEVAMHAALTGHLVFSTLHTNDAAGTIPRLIDLGVKPAIIAPALNVTMAQRLVRKLCPQCKKEGHLSEEQQKAIQEESKNFPKTVVIPPQTEWNIFTAHQEGCNACNHTGYKGRLGIFELIFIDETIEHMIMTNPSEFDIKKAALQQGQITMRQDGILKIMAGMTDYAEYERVVGV
ncbi:MAG: ATPase, T2SS/T4P/T4SS family [Candidatus Sungbacteria bacterium]|nr:ATPase, T2SS/T4P/T4SS family [bacterium]MDZ4260036.1 ATPase, T2SS/T4P/T4SS family [Candidatus Sungbacteria bacterium]